MRIVQLVGGHPSVTDHPVIEGAERWIIGSARSYDKGRKVDRIFDPHDWGLIQQKRPLIWDSYRADTVPVYLLDAHPDLPTSVSYPLEQIQAHFADDGPEVCFAGTQSFMFALALYEGVDWIDLAGIPLRGKPEYEGQRESATYWIGRARGMGVRVTTAKESGLATVPVLYGYGTPTGYPNPWCLTDGLPGMWPKVQSTPTPGWTL